MPRPKRGREKPSGDDTAKTPKGSYFVPQYLYKFDKPLVTPEETEKLKQEELKKKKSKANQFIEYCKWSARTFPKFAEDDSITPDLANAIHFLKWRLSSGELNAGSKAAFIIGALVAVLAITIGFLNFGFENITLLGVYAAFGIVTFLAAPSLVKAYPLSAAQEKKNRILIEIPKIIGYMNMSMKLTPNLERAVEFAAQHGEGELSQAFKDLLWNVKTGTFGSLEEGLDDLAYTWGKYSVEFKQALMTVRSSVLEPDDARRHALLDSALEGSLKEVGNKLSDQATALKSPSMNMFYLGVLLPLILIIVLPIGSVFAENPFLANPFILAGLYNLALPVMLILYANMILSQRPPIYVPPEIPDDHPELPRKGSVKIGSFNIPVTAGVLLILILGGTASYFAHVTLDPNADAIVRDVYGAQSFEEFSANRSEEDVKLFLQTQDLQPFFLISGSILTVSMAISFYLYFTAVYKRRIQEDIMIMEEEFKDSAYLIASRLGQNKPIEDAVKYVGEFLPESKLATKVFGKVKQNITLLGLTFEGAVFDPVYGALKNIPSQLIQTSMKIITDSVQLGVNVAARAMMALSQQLQSFDVINRQIKTELNEVTTTMSSMAAFIAPLVLGITTALQKIILDTISSVAGQGQQQALPDGVDLGGFGTPSTGLTSGEGLAGAADPTQFLTILVIYVVQVVVILTYFGASIKEGKNPLIYKISIAQTLPIAVLLFLVAAFFAKNLLVFSG